MTIPFRRVRKTRGRLSSPADRACPFALGLYEKQRRAPRGPALSAFPGGLGPPCQLEVEHRLPQHRLLVVAQLHELGRLHHALRPLRGPQTQKLTPHPQGFTGHRDNNLDLFADL